MVKVETKSFPTPGHPDITLKLLAVRATCAKIIDSDHYFNNSKMPSALKEIFDPISNTIGQIAINLSRKYRLDIPKNYGFKCRIQNCTFDTPSEAKFREHQFYSHHYNHYPYQRCPVCNIKLVIDKIGCHHITKHDIPDRMNAIRSARCWCGRRFHTHKQYQSHYSNYYRQHRSPNVYPKRRYK